MSNLKFNEDGPKVISEKDLQDHEKLRLKTMKQTFLIWINDAYDDGVRRLALRDILHNKCRQNAKKQATRCFDFYWDNMCNWANPGLEQILEFRPKLVDELADELGYCLTRPIAFYQPELDFLIETILKAKEDANHEL